MNLLKSHLKLTRSSTITLIALMLFFQTSLVSAATLTSTVNRNNMSTNETLTLTVTLDEQASSSALELDGLKKDFEILGMSPRNSTSISTVNGSTRRVATTQWTITLAAKREGSLLIPAFTIGQANSKAISIKALSNAQLKSGASTQTTPLLATGLAENAVVYPGQQLIYRIELSAAANVSDLNGAPLEIPGASVEIVGQQQYRNVDNGVARTVIILTYAIFAQDSGKLTIPSINFTGLIGGRRSIFGSQGQQVVGRTNPVPIVVKAKPVNKNGSPWFPAEAVSIRSSWSADQNSMQTGSPITRTITVRAQGQQATAIPPLGQVALINSSIKSYKDKPQLDTSKTTDGFSATRVEAEAIVVNKSGDIELPAISIDWFNVKKDQWEQATLPAETIKVSGQAVTQSAPIITPVAINDVLVAPQKASLKTHWAWPIATGMLALICIIQTILLIRRKPIKQTQSARVKEKRSESEAERWKSLLKDLGKNDPKIVRSSIVEWLRAANPNSSNVSLNTIYESSYMELIDSIKTLEASLFSNNSSTKFNDYKLQLKHQLENYRKYLHTQDSFKNNEKTRPQLAALYPNS